jgi:DNA-binding NtrC family response regulator
MATRHADPSILKRLAVVRIDIPPLRERREDVALLAETFMRDLAREYGRKEKRFDPPTLRALTKYSWPGNVRELRNVVEGLLLLGAGETVEVRDLPEELGGARAPAEDLYQEFDSLGRGVEAFERYYVRRILAEERGDREAAARRLRISPRDLDARLARLGDS